MSTEDKKFALEMAARVGAKPGDLIQVAGSILAYLAGGATADQQPVDAEKGGAEGADAKTPSPSPTPSPAPSASAPEASSAPTPDAPKADATGGAPVGSAYEGDVAKLQAKCMALAARDGQPALKEQFDKLGASKWSEVPAEKYAELWDALTATGV